MPRTKPAYDEEFRRGAVELLVSSGRPLKRVAAELGVCANTLRLWRNVAVGAGSEGRAETRREPREAAAADGPHGETELRRLRRENEYLRRQRDILKKAMSILGEDPPLGMR
jgi:transposase